MNPNPPDYLKSKHLSQTLADRITESYASKGFPQVQAYVIEEKFPLRHYAVRINIRHNVQDLTAEIREA